MAPLAQTRITVLSEITAYVDFLFLDQPVHDEAAWAKAIRPGAADVLRDARKGLEALEALEALEGARWQAEDLKDVLVAVSGQHGLRLGKAQAPIRVATTGRTVGLPLFESLEALGRERVLARIDAALERLDTP